MSRLAALAVWLGAATALAGPSGRVVRVERAGGGGASPRLCEIRGDTGTCLGDEPHAGQAVIVLDDHHVVAEVQILEASPLVASCPTLWTVKTRTVHGPPAEHEGMGVIDPGVNLSRARVIDRERVPGSPSGQPGEEVWRAVDRDGDGAADIVVTRYSCDASGKVLSSGSAYCIDVWTRLGARMVRTTQLNFGQCNF